MASKWSAGIDWIKFVNVHVRTVRNNLQHIIFNAKWSNTRKRWEENLYLYSYLFYYHLFVIFTSMLMLTIIILFILFYFYLLLFLKEFKWLKMPPQELYVRTQIERYLLRTIKCCSTIPHLFIILNKQFW